MCSTTREVNLYCKNGYLLQINGNGEMKGAREKDNFGKKKQFFVFNLRIILFLVQGAMA